MLTPDEIERRRHFITASDVSKLFGASAWGNAADVYLEKVHGIFKPGNAATEAGSILEPSVIAWAETQLGPIHPGDWKVSENGIIAATLDGLTVNGNLPVEAKTTAITGPGKPQEWGDEGTDEIPVYYLYQVHTQLLVTGAPMAFVPALIGGRGFVMYQVHRSETLCQRITEWCESFWNNHVLQRVPPEGLSPRLETLKYLKRVPNQTVEISDDIVSRYLELRGRLSEINAKFEDAKADLIAALGTAEVGEWSGGECTYYTQTRKAHEVKESTFPVLRIRNQSAVEEAKSRPKRTPKPVAEAVDHAAELRAAKVEVNRALESMGYKLKDESASGSRYYCGLGLPDIRVADHAANDATSSWMIRKGVLELRVDSPEWPERIKEIEASLTGASV